jgi:hypothetical protein
MTEEQWARERADVIDDVVNDPPRFGDGREERHREAAIVTPAKPQGNAKR